MPAWYAMAGAGCAGTGAGQDFAAISACFALSSAFQRVSVSHSGIPAQQQTNNTMSGMLSQNHVAMMTLPVIGFGERLTQALTKHGAVRGAA
jgi:hypothetical protein